MAEKPDLIRSMPVLEVADVERSVAFYTEKLGFFAHQLWGEEGEPPAFCIVQRGNVTIALDRSREAGRKPNNQYWAAYLYVADADGLHDAFKAAGVEVVRGPENTEYGCRDFDVRDPDGHLIAFGQDVNPGKEPGPGLA